VEGIELAQYGMEVAGRKQGRQPALVFDNHNCEYLLQQRNAANDLRLPLRWPAAAYSIVQWQKLRRYETMILNSADATVAVSEADQQAMQRIAPAASITVVSNGIDLDAYQPGVPSLDTYINAGKPMLVFTGKMDYRPNIDAALWFARQVLPLVVAQEPGACLQLVGMNPHARLDNLRNNPNVEITGAVADTRPYIGAAAVYVIPMRIGGGTRFKALEAMASGKAIVSTSLGIEGIPVRSEREMLLADTPEAFASAILRLITDLRTGASLQKQLGMQARRFVEQHYGWPTIIPQLDKVYHAVKGA
jgi:glycosyltransferase involved in cell wall biosynthesis